jgi:D-threo-aldose 1-dehydrogenase
VDEIALGTSGRRTTRLGYGCSSLMGAMGRKQSLTILEASFDAGVRHFDVAPMYGYGEAEGCLGEFLQRHPGQMTVTTKYGIPPAAKRSLVSLARGLVRPVVQRFPGLKQRLAGAASSVTHNEVRAKFSPAEAKASLEHSLMALRTDRIDVWLLHEAEAQDLTDEGLLRLMEDLVAQGTVGTFGIGSENAKIPALLVERPEYCRTLQYEWSVLNPVVRDGAIFRIHHRALTENFRALHAALVREEAICRRWCDVVGVNLGDASVLAQLMLKAALVVNSGSVILFSSKDPRHIQANVRVAGDEGLVAPALRLYELVQSEREQIAQWAGV